MKNSYTILLLLLFLLFCKPGHTQNPDSAIVLIFDSIPTLVRSISPFKGLNVETSMHQVRIFDNFYEHPFNPRSGVLDTIIFLPQKDYVILSFFYELMRQPFDYVVKRGDTVRFRFVNGMPYAVTKNKKREVVVNYEYSKLADSGFKRTSFELYKEPISLAKSMNEAVNGWRFSKELYLPARELIASELSILSKREELKQEFPYLYSFYTIN